MQTHKVSLTPSLRENIPQAVQPLHPFSEPSRHLGQGPSNPGLPRCHKLQAERRLDIDKFHRSDHDFAQTNTFSPMKLDDTHYMMDIHYMKLQIFMKYAGATHFFRLYAFMDTFRWSLSKRFLPIDTLRSIPVMGSGLTCAWPSHVCLAAAGMVNLEPSPTNKIIGGPN